MTWFAYGVAAAANELQADLEDAHLYPADVWPTAPVTRPSLPAQKTKDALPRGLFVST